ncbi:ankyrin repeat-containing domain protein [Stachybotrys elegans]|uniref:Ankyrin repeat-containing domain protein n=1 Tax=Stachybotrys elegans TaxID=80388 RepID=A0A8K0WP73_9HYPO|nr:ankyrin repeat-containing domain protein [Stachybotrys elegans]
MSESQTSDSDSSVHELPERARGEDDASEAPAEATRDGDDAKSEAPSEISSVATENLLGLAKDEPIAYPEPEPKLLGLTKPWGWSLYDDYDVITVHGLRDDHKTAWQTSSGDFWLRDQLFPNINIRQLDYSYAVDDSARVFGPRGIEAEARNLIRDYNQFRQELPDTETGRPILWICHDIGGTIVKQALLEAAKARQQCHDEDVDTWEQHKDTRFRIATHSSAIIFLGSPHKSESIDTLEDELHNLMELPGPTIKHGIMKKIRTLAQQVSQTNLDFIDARLFSRLVHIDVFYMTDLETHAELEAKLLPSPEKQATSEQDDKKSEDDKGSEHGIEKADGDGAEETKTPQSSNGGNDGDKGEGKSEEPLKDEQTPDPNDPKSDESGPRKPAFPQFPEVPATPFSRFSINLCTNFEMSARWREASIEHANHVKGDNGLPVNDTWISGIVTRFNDNWYALKVSNDLIRIQCALLSLIPPPRPLKVHVDPTVSDKQQLSFLTWFSKHEKYDLFHRTFGPHLMHIEGDGIDPKRFRMISQYFHSFYEDDNLTKWGNDYGGASFRFEFSKFDSRYNSIKSMLLTFISETSWRSWSKSEGVAGALNLINDCRVSSLSDIWSLFVDMRKCAPVTKFTFFLSCFDECVEEEKAWFVENVIEQQRHSDLNFRLIFTTRGPDALLSRLIDDSERIRLADCPAPVVGYAIDEREFDPSGLTASLEEVFERRPNLASIREELEGLMSECQASPYLGYRILDWLSRYGRGRPISKISASIAKLRPVTPQNMMEVFLGCLTEDKRELALSIYKWVRYAREPLTLEELAHALVVSRDPEDTPLLDIDYESLSDDIQTIFCGIIESDGRDIKFFHDSFYTFTPPGIDDTDLSSIHAMFAQTCLKYLMREDVQSRYAELSMENFDPDPLLRPIHLPRRDFLSYAARFWIEHYELSGPDTPLELAISLFDNEKVRRKWTEAHYIMSHPFTRIGRSYESTIPLLASLGLEEIMDRQIEAEKGSKYFNQDIWLAITEAGRHGSAAMVRKLLGYVDTQDVDAQVAGLQDAVYWSALPGNDEVLSMILEQIKSQDSFSWPQSVVCRAAVSGCSDVLAAFAAAGGDISEAYAVWFTDSPLHGALYWGREDTVDLLIKLGVNLEAVNHAGWTPLMLSLDVGNPRIIQKLLDAGSNVDAKDNDGVPAIMTPIYSGDHVALDMLLTAGAKHDVGEYDTEEDGLRPPIIHAVDYGRAGCTRVLLKHGANIETESKIGTPLYMASLDDEAMVQLLLEHGADPNKFYTDKEMLMVRATRSNTRILGWLIDKGAKLDAQETWEEASLKTPLTAAINLATPEILEYLIDRGASLDYIPEGAESPVFVSAFRCSDINMAKLLLRKNADIKWRRDDGWGPLEAAYDIPAHLSLFLEHGADPNAMCDRGTVLMMASRWGFSETVKILLEHKSTPVDLEAKFTWDPEDDDYNSTALQFALKTGNFEIAIMLLDAGAKLDDSGIYLKYILQSITDEDNQHLHLILERCLKGGAKTDYSDSDGNTILHAINNHIHVSTIQLLLDAGAPLDTANAAGITPLMVAIQNANIEAMKLFISKGARTNTCTPSYGTFLHLALEQTSQSDDVVFEMVKLLCEAKVDPALPGPEPERESFLCTAAGSGSQYDPSLRRKLTRHLVDELHMDPNIRSGNGVGYPLLAAARVDDTGLVEYLIRRGADPNVADSQGRRAIHHLVTKGAVLYRRMTHALRDAGADLEAPDNFGRTPLHFAAAGIPSWHLGYSLPALRKHLDINVRDIDGWTPLMWASRKMGNFDVAVGEFVNNQHANIWPRSKDGKWSALKLARFSDLGDEYEAMLMPPEDEQEREGVDGTKETWDPEFHQCEKADKVTWSARCDSCLMQSPGTWQKCTTCNPDVMLCFKCFPHRKEMHAADHEFEEYLESKEDDAAAPASRAASRVSHVSVDSDGNPVVRDTSATEVTETNTDDDDTDDDTDDDDDSDD